MEERSEKRTKRRIIWQILMAAICILFLGSGCAETVRAEVSLKNIRTVSGGKFIYRNEQWYYRQKNGTYAKDCLLKIQGKTYYFSDRGRRMYGWQKLPDGKQYYFGKKAEGYMYKSAWLKDKKGNLRYFLMKNGRKAVGLKTMQQGSTYYFKKNGRVCSGWQTIDGGKYYFGSPKVCKMYKKKWLLYKGSYYYFGTRGKMVTGWKHVKTSGTSYYFYKNGKAATGKKKIGGVLYYFNERGKVLRTGADLSVSSKAAILVEAETGKLIFGKNENQPLANASTTKIMTCILAMEKGKDNDIVTASPYAASQEPTKLYLHAGEKFRKKDLLYSLMIPSHNDTAVALAEYVSGSVPRFVNKMNKRAEALGCTNTHFATPNGLDRNLNHYTTASDLTKIMACALKKPLFVSIIGKSSYSFASKSGYSYFFTTTNQLLGEIPGLVGGKTGYTNKAGHCFVGVVKGKSGKTYISVTLGAPSSSSRWEDSRKLLLYARKL